MEGPITIRRLQNYIKNKTGEFFPETRNDFILKFMEESGELARAILRKYPHAEGDEIKGTIEEEFCDVLFYLLALAELYGVDFEKWIPVKERETDRRYGTDYFERYFLLNNSVQFRIFYYQMKTEE